MNIALVWKDSPGSGTIEVLNGRLKGLRALGGAGKAAGAAFTIPPPSPARLQVAIDQEQTAPGAHATLVSVRWGATAFSFFLRDVQTGRPIWIPDYGVAVAAARDKRDYDQIAAAIRAEGWSASPSGSRTNRRKPSRRPLRATAT